MLECDRCDYSKNQSFIITMSTKTDGWFRRGKKKSNYLICLKCLSALYRGEWKHSDANINWFLGEVRKVNNNLDNEKFQEEDNE